MACSSLLAEAERDADLLGDFPARGVLAIQEELEYQRFDLRFGQTELRKLVGGDRHEFAVPAHCGSSGDSAAMSACAVPGESGSESVARSCKPPAAGSVRGNKASDRIALLAGAFPVPASTCKMAANCVRRLWRRRSLSGGVEVMAMGCAGTCSSFKSTSANRPTQGNSLERQRSINGGVLIRMPYARCADNLADFCPGTPDMLQVAFQRLCRDNPHVHRHEMRARTHSRRPIRSVKRQSGTVLQSCAVRVLLPT